MHPECLGTFSNDKQLVDLVCEDFRKPVPPKAPKKKNSGGAKVCKKKRSGGAKVCRKEKVDQCLPLLLSRMVTPPLHQITVSYMSDSDADYPKERIFFDDRKNLYFDCESHSNAFG